MRGRRGQKEVPKRRNLGVLMPNLPLHIHQREVTACGGAVDSLLVIAESQACEVTHHGPPALCNDPLTYHLARARVEVPEDDPLVTRGT